MDDAKDRLARIRGVLLKRRERVALCKEHQAFWKKAYEAKGTERALRKLTYWHEQLDKAVLGVKEYEARERRILKKIAVLQENKPEASHTTSGASVPTDSWNPYRRPIANWMIPWLRKTHNNGWRGYVTSGFRSAEYQCEVCKGVCGNCGGCPGTCAAPGTSNHGQTEYPGGAVDVTDYYAFAAIQSKIGSPLHNTLGSRDPVHFSVAGN